ncbi:unnamed protein product [Dibothriocephalus latus]|uniref:Uncharacterized protein n=1 Tax=Dibothriocephalus latus TaxID=60516 RepID=A0A3P7P0D5_DIBLA|nr:unnamed protein product [Dibothriocephalus latus]
MDMYAEPKCLGAPMGRIEFHCLSTLPIERDQINGGCKDPQVSFTVEEEEEEEGDFILPDAFSDPDDSDHAEDSEGEQTGEEEVGANRQKKIIKSVSVGQIKQKVVRLLKRLKLFDPNEVSSALTQSYLLATCARLQPHHSRNLVAKPLTLLYPAPHIYDYDVLRPTYPPLPADNQSFYHHLTLPYVSVRKSASTVWLDQKRDFISEKSTGNYRTVSDVQYRLAIIRIKNEKRTNEQLRQSILIVGRHWAFPFALKDENLQQTAI